MTSKPIEEVMLATDTVLKAIIRPTADSVDHLIAEAQKGETRLSVLHSSLYCALYSARETDSLNIPRLAQLLKYVEIVQDAPEYLGPEERDSWVPSSEEVSNWRKCALED
jgi:hypothetical protein